MKELAAIAILAGLFVLMGVFVRGRSECRGCDETDCDACEALEAKDA